MCNIPDFLADFLKNRTEADHQSPDEWREYTQKVDEKYNQMFPDSTLYLGVFDDTPMEDFYQMMEECIKQGKPMEELYPDYTINWDDYDEDDCID